GGCCDVRVMGYLTDGVSYVNGSVRHAPTGVPATIVVEVGPAAPEATPTPSSHPTAAPTARPATGTLAQTGGGRFGLALALVLLAAVVMLGGGLTFARRH